MQLSQEKLICFPNLDDDSYRVTSEETWDYNCAAWAAGDNARWWQPPDEEPYYYWPEGAPEEITVSDYCSMFESLGFEECPTGLAEEGYLKIAIYGDKGGAFKHVARQVPSGGWTSKLGDWEDIWHATTECLEGDFYGKVKIYMRVSRASPT